VEMNQSFVRTLLSDHDLLEDSDSSEYCTYRHLCNISGRTLPPCEGRYRGRLRQQCGHLVGSTIKIKLLQGLIEQVQSRNTGEGLGAIRRGSGEISLEIAATGATLSLVRFLDKHVATYR
jgi:hypothetical protein